ncbi:MAG: hypothetical protein GY796_24515 [Chloroflexi bacterium]|nr:hypothetical protein [Chloroflexota bacterium]
MRLVPADDVLQAQEIARQNWQAAWEKIKELGPRTDLEIRTQETAIRQGYGPTIEADGQLIRANGIAGQRLSVMDDVASLAGQQVDDVRMTLATKGYTLIEAPEAVTWQGSGVEIWHNPVDGSVMRVDTLGNPTGFVIKNGEYEGFDAAGTIPHLHAEPFYTPTAWIAAKEFEVPKYSPIHNQ